MGSKQTRRRRSLRAFTFIELMVAISILAVLMAILIPRLVLARYSAYHSACIENERMIATALESYNVDYMAYPASLNVLSNPGKAYISALPVCPSDPAKQYQAGYTVSGDSKAFTLMCPGVHYLQNPAVFVQNYPMYISTGQLIP